MLKDEKIDRKLAHGMFVGPPGSGKSSLMDRLLNRLKLKKQLSASTGISESVVIVNVDLNPSTFHSVTVMEDSMWTEMEYNVSIVRQMGEENIATPLAVATSAGLEEVINRSSEPESIPNLHEVLHSSITASHFQSESDAEVKSACNVTAAVDCTIKKIIHQAIKKCGSFSQFKHFLKKSFSLYLRDTGGQVEFQEMLPLLIFGPSIFFFVFRLDLDFRSKFRIEYRKSADECINSYTSSIPLRKPSSSA